MPKENRAAIVTLYRTGKGASSIARVLKMSERTVRYTITRFNEHGGLLDRPRSGRPRTACTATNRSIIKKRIERNPRRSMRQMARTLDISERSVRRIVKDLGCHPYKLIKGHALTEEMKTKRLQNSRRLLRCITRGRYRSILFTDEKIFTMELAHNHQNDRQLLSKGSPSAARGVSVTRSHFPASIMVWGGISATGKTPLVFVEKGAKINAQIYQESILKKVVQPWAHKHYGDRTWTFQQDWAPAHAAMSTIVLCDELFPQVWKKDSWPSNSPDLNPMDYAVWSILERKVCACRHSTIASLKTALTKAWGEISVEQLSAIVENFPKRLKACISEGGGHFEFKM